MSNHSNVQPIATRAEINRQNAQHSTGPRTPEGKQRVSVNAVKHNLSGKDVLLEAGEAEIYNDLYLSLCRSFDPRTAQEIDIILAIRDAQWRLNSIPALHINLLTLATEEHMEQYQDYSDNPQLQRSMARTAGYRANMRLFEQFSRHEGRLQRTIEKLTKVLTDLIEFRRNQERAAALDKARNQQNQPATKQSQPVPAPQAQPAQPTAWEDV